MMGRKALPAAQALIADLQLESQITPEEFVAEREAKLRALFPDCKVLPGVERLVQHLQSHNVPMCVATSSHRRHFELKTSKHQELFSKFDHIVTGDMVQRGKPEPDIFQAAAAMWSPAPDASACLVFEDAPLGVEAAVAAGMKVVMVPDANLAAEQTKAATLVCHSLADFDPGRVGLPEFSKT
jgi:HAD superfamily hydrolase (TIGR01509 family)